MKFYNKGILCVKRMQAEKYFVFLKFLFMCTEIEINLSAGFTCLWCFATAVIVHATSGHFNLWYVAVHKINYINYRFVVVSSK
jgi:hypothetical protein